MSDKKVYKTDYESEFTTFFKTMPAENKTASKSVTAEVKKYTTINKLRDNVSINNTRNKIWEGF